MAQTAWLIDGMAYVFRSYFAMRSMAAPDGTPINAVFGLGMTLQKFLNERKPELVACCFDAGARTFRNGLFTAYKANRAEPPAELLPQFDLCRALAAHMGIACATTPGFEADDLIATLTTQLLGRGTEVVIVSGDKDLMQLVGPGVQLYDLARDQWWDEERVPERLGVGPGQVADLLALTGDAADNIPGVRGIGPKAAVALLQAYGSLEAIYADLSRVESLPLRGAKGLRGKLEAGHGSALLSRQLVGLKHDAPCALHPDQMPYRGADSEALESFATQWGLGAVARKTPRR